MQIGFDEVQDLIQRLMLRAEEEEWTAEEVLEVLSDELDTIECERF